MSESLFGRGSSLAASARWVVLAALGLGMTGMVILASVTTFEGGDPYSRLRRQGLYLVAALVVGCVVYHVGHRRLGTWSRPLLWVTWALLLVLLIPGMPRQYGASRWLELGPINVQPSEIAKLTMVIFLSAFAAQRGERLRSFKEGFLPAMAYVGLTALFVVGQPDLGQTLLILALSGAVLMVNGLRLAHLMPVGLVAAPVLLYVMSERFDHVRGRLDSFLGEMDPTTQVGQGLLALGAGGILGRGVGEGRAHLDFVPKIHNDFILVAIGEQLGLVGSLAVVALFLILFIHGMRIAFAARDGFAFSVAFGVSFMIAIQAAVNVAVATRSVPSKGTSLPLVSYGGSGLLVAGAALGLLLAVAREAATSTETAAPPVPVAEPPAPPGAEGALA